MLKCRVAFSQQVHRKLTVPSNRYKGDIVKHVDIRRELSDRIRDLLSSEGEVLPVTPRPYQIDTVKAVGSWLEDPSGPPRAHIAHATGLGKTTVFSLITRSCVGLRTLIVVPTKVLVEQVARVVTRFTGGVVGHMASINSIRNEQGEIVSVRGHEHQDTVITTNASFKMYAARILADFDPHFIVYDECHWAYVPECQESLAMFSEAVIVGFSATPDYLGTVVKNGYVPVTLDNGQVLWGDRQRFAETHFGPRLDSRSLRWGIENGYLSPLAWGMIEFNMDLSTLPITDGEMGPDYNSQALQTAMARHWPLMTQTICRLYQNAEYDLPNRQTFAVCPSVDAAEELAEAVSQVGISAACVSGGSTTLERNTILSAFAEKEIRFISSVMVLREGWDAPAEVCMMLRPTKSRVAYEQYLGRTTRLNADGSPKVALMLDLHQQSGTFSPLSAPMLFGTPYTSVRSGGFLIPPEPTGDDDVSLSPYLPEHITPKLVLVPALEYQFYANEEGLFEADGETWATLQGLVQKLSIGYQALDERLNNGCVRTRQGRNTSNKVAVFYALSDAQKVCADLLHPRAGKNGIMEADGETWGTLEMIARTFRVRTPTVEWRLSEHAVRQRNGRAPGGQARVFYSLLDAKVACADLLEDIPRSGKDGTFEADGEVWGTVWALSKKLEVHADTVNRCMVTMPCRSRPGYAKSEKADFYALSDVKVACAHVLEELPKSEVGGFFTADDEVWGTLLALAKSLGISRSALRSKLKDNSSVRTKLGFNRSGVKTIFYSEIDVRKVCSKE